MENATDALKMAFAMFVFIIALSIAFSLISQAKQTADSVLITSDKTTYYQNFGEDIELMKEDRVVGYDTVVSTIYNQPQEELYIKINDGDVIDPNRTDEEAAEVIKTLNTEDKYYENIYEITTEGQYSKANDGTKLIVYGSRAKVRTYIMYTKYDGE